MLHSNLLKTHAPDSTFLLFHPQDTGSPGQDFCHHIARNPHRRIELEDTMLVGDNVIVRIEPDLGSAEDRESEAKIVTVRYAERVLGNRDDAAEFIRCTKLLAGEDARGHDLQIIASYYYGEARRRPASEVLKEMSMLAMQLTAVTATEDSRQYGDVVETDVPFVEEPMTASDRHQLFMERAAEVLGENTVENVYRDEIRAKSIYRHNGQVQGFAYDDAAPFLAFMRDAAERGADEESLEAMWTSFERVSEQYDEGHVVSLHMSDSEKVIVVGTLDDDVNEDYLPADARHLAAALRLAFIGGKGAQAARKLTADVHYARMAQRAERNPAALRHLPEQPGHASAFSAAPLSDGEINEWMDSATSLIYNRRVKRTARAGYVTTGGPDANRFGRPSMYTVPYTIMVNPDAETRSYVVSVLEKLLAQMKGDFHLRGQRANPLYREFHRRIRTAQDTALVAAAIKEAFAAKEEGRISLSLFTALNTANKLQRWALESKPLSQAALRLVAEIKSASRSKLMFLRWAMYGTNKPDHAVHALTRQEKARVWEELKAATQLANPAPAN
jgi:hypothetical protein